MNHTRQSLSRNRGLVIIIAVLCVVWMLEPATGFMLDACQGLLDHLKGGVR